MSFTAFRCGPAVHRPFLDLPQDGWSALSDSRDHRSSRSRLRAPIAGAGHQSRAREQEARAAFASAGMGGRSAPGSVPKVGVSRDRRRPAVPPAVSWRGSGRSMKGSGASWNIKDRKWSIMEHQGKAVKERQSRKGSGRRWEVKGWHSRCTVEQHDRAVSSIQNHMQGQ